MTVLLSRSHFKDQMRGYIESAQRAQCLAYSNSSVSGTWYYYYTGLGTYKDARYVSEWVVHSVRLSGFKLGMGQGQLGYSRKLLPRTSLVSHCSFPSVYTSQLVIIHIFVHLFGASLSQETKLHEARVHVCFRHHYISCTWNSTGKMAGAQEIVFELMNKWKKNSGVMWDVGGPGRWLRIEWVGKKASKWKEILRKLSLYEALGGNTASSSIWLEGQETVPIAQVIYGVAR